jgi:AraC-like DNA-binding protein
VATTGQVEEEPAAAPRRWVRMPPAKPKKKRSSREASLGALEAAAEFYLRACYGTRTAARAKEFAQFLALARPSLSRRVAKIAGMSLSQFLHERQIARAEWLLEKTPLSVEQIALASAFGTFSTFYRRFKAIVGMTPGKFRERQRSGATKCQ